MKVIHNTSVEGLGKRGGQFQFLIAVPTELVGRISKGATLIVNSVQVVLKECDDEYASFELELAQLEGTELAHVEVGSQVHIRVS